MRNYSPRTLLLLWSIAAPLAAQERPGLPAATIESAERAIATEMARQTIPGLSVSVVTGRKVQWSSGFGMADLENYVPARAATVYRLGSISKPITAVAV